MFTGTVLVVVRVTDFMFRFGSSNPAATILRLGHIQVPVPPLYNTVLDQTLNVKAWMSNRS